MNRDSWNKRYENKEFVWTVDPNRFLVAEAGELHPGRALDIATGEGRNAVWLSEQGWQVTAVDFSDVGLAKAHQLATLKNVTVDWVLADATGYQPRSADYDLVLICYLQLPATQRRQVFENARAALKPGGTLLYIAHDRSNIEHGWGGPKDPAVLATPDIVATELTGLTVFKAEVVRRPVTGSDRAGEPEAVALDTLVRAVRPPAP